MSSNHGIKDPSRSRKPIVGTVTLSTFPPALLAMMKARTEDGATNKEIMAEFNVSEAVVCAVRKVSSFSSATIKATEKALPAAVLSVTAAAMGKITPEKLDACSAPQLWMMSAIGIDKYRLLTDKSTQNVAIKDVSAQAMDGMNAAGEALRTLLAQNKTSTQAT